MPLPLGWVALKNRDTLVEEEEGYDFSSVAEEEAAWFKKNLVSCGTSQGIPLLLEMVSRMLTAHISRHWVPQAHAHLESELEALDAQLASLGTPTSSMTLGIVLSEFADIFLVHRGMARNLEIFCRTAISANLDMVHLYEDRAPNSVRDNIKTKANIEQQVVDKLRQVVGSVAETITGTIRETFTESHDPGIRLPRFQTLCTALCDSLAEFVSNGSCRFVQITTAKISAFMERLVGLQWSWQYHFIQLKDLILECTVNMLLAPLLGDSQQISAQLEELLSKGDLLDEDCPHLRNQKRFCHRKGFAPTAATYCRESC